MKALKHLNKYFWKYKFHLFFGIVFITISNFFALYPAVVIRQSIDMVIESIARLNLFRGTNVYQSVYQDLLKALSIFASIIFGMAILKGVFMFFMRQTIIVMSRHIEYDLKNEIYEHYQKLQPSFFKLNSTGDLMNRISEDVSRVRMYVGPAIMYLINLTILIALVIYSMLNASVTLTLFVLLPLPILAISVYLINNYILKKSELVQQQLSRITTFVQETFSGIRILKSYNRLAFFGEEFSKEAQTYNQRNISLITYNAISLPIIMGLIGLSTLLTVYVGGFQIANGEISPGIIAEFIIYINMLTWPVASIGFVASMIQRAAASQKRINEMLHTIPEIVNNTSKPSLLQGKITFKNVSLVYPDTQIKALKDVSFEILPGKTLAILGKTGSGKSSIIQMVNRFYDTSGGEVLIDDVNIKEHHLSNLRDSIGYVPQEVFLFSDTIHNNIIFGLNANNFSEEELSQKVYQAAKDAHIYDNIIDLPQQFQTKLGERGVTLSGGQKQRISIARAIIKNPQILLFDDCLSAVDAETEEIILTNLLRIMKNKTTILVTHRISAAKNADKIIVLENGSAVEEGTHEDLLLRKGFYFELYQQQNKMKEKQNSH